MLDIVPLESRHTGANLAQEMNTVLLQWGIKKDNVSGMNTDNGANIKLAVELLLGPGKHVSCVAHSLNLVVPEAMKGVPDLEVLRDKVKSIFTYFKRSVSAADDLRATQERAGCEILKLKMSQPDSILH